MHYSALNLRILNVEYEVVEQSSFFRIGKINVDQVMIPTPLLKDYHFHILLFAACLILPIFVLLITLLNNFASDNVKGNVGVNSLPMLLAKFIATKEIWSFGIKYEPVCEASFQMEVV